MAGDCGHWFDRILGRRRKGMGDVGGVVGTKIGRMRKVKTMAKEKGCERKDVRGVGGREGAERSWAWVEGGRREVQDQRFCMRLVR